MHTSRRLVLTFALGAGLVVVGAPSAGATPSGGSVAPTQVPAPTQDAPPDGEGDPGPDDAGADRAIPDAGSLQQAAEAEAAHPELERNDAELSAAAAGPIEDFRYDSLVLKGYASEVCAGGVKPGAQRAFNEIRNRFGGSPGTMYSCRERWDSINDFDCNGTVSNSSSSFYSTCWSNHARGQAIDLMTGYQARGVAVVNWLLAEDQYGNDNAIARRLGVQQILFADRCWNSDGDRGIASWSQMRECGIGHFDHVHIDMTNPGAAGNVSYWGVAPPAPAPKQNGQFVWDTQTGQWSVLAWDNEARFRTVRTGRWGANWDERLAGDLDADGEVDDLLFWDRDTGQYASQRWSGNVATAMRNGYFSRGYDQIVVGDFDGNGRLNDTMLWDNDTGFFLVHSWSASGPTVRRSGYWSRGYDRMVTGDFDDNGRVNEFLLWDRDTGYYVVHTWNGFQPTTRRSGTWTVGYDEIVMGDWDNAGGHDDLFLWDRHTGGWIIKTWMNTIGDPDGADKEPAKKMLLENKASGRWSPGYDQFVAGDLDQDGRSDDMFVWDNDNGFWVVRSWWRYRATDVRSGTWAASWDDITTGSWS